MAGTTRTETAYLTQQLAAEPFTFDFFRAIRLLQAAHPELPAVGESSTPQDDFIRFVQNPSLRFAPSTLESFVAPEDRPPRLAVSFFGLFGPNGPLPPHLTDYARERQQKYSDPTFVAFANVFHHRLLSFFFRSWAAGQKTVDMDRAEGRRFRAFIGSLFGLGMESLQDRDAVPDAAKLFFSGRLCSQARNAEGLQSILQEYFHIPTAVETFVGEWIDLPPESQCRLGATPETGSLGLTSIVGSKVWDCQLKFRIKAGPMSLADYERMLPDGPAFKRLHTWVMNYIGYEFTFDVQLILAQAEVPGVQLGSSGKLGWTTWLKSGPLGHDSSDLIIHPPGN